MLDPAELELHRLIAAAPNKNREFHSADLRQPSGQAAYDKRVDDAMSQYDSPKFAAALAVHETSILAREKSN
ncbi:MAG: hypothetical protein ACRCS3_12370 [Paracoccaceae bacterium]